MIHQLVHNYCLMLWCQVIIQYLTNVKIRPIMLRCHTIEWWCCSALLTRWYDPPIQTNLHIMSIFSLSLFSLSQQLLTYQLWESVGTHLHCICTSDMTTLHVFYVELTAYRIHSPSWVNFLLILHITMHRLHFNF